MNSNRWIAAVVVLLALAGLGYYSYYLANRQVAPSAKVKVIKRAAKKVHAPKCVCPAVIKEDLSIPPRPPAPAVTAPIPPAPPAVTPAPPVAPPVVAPVAPKPADDGWRPVLTKDGWIRLGPPSTVPPPRVPIKGIEGPDVR